MDLTALISNSKIIITKTQEIVDEMKQGDHYKFSNLCKKISDELGFLQEDVSAIVQFFVQNSSDVKSEVGRNGGVYKGGRLPTSKKKTSITTGSKLVNEINGIIESE